MSHRVSKGQAAAELKLAESQTKLDAVNARLMSVKSVLSLAEAAIADAKDILDSIESKA